MNEYKYYLLFNPELKNLNRIELRNSYFYLNPSLEGSRIHPPEQIELAYSNFRKVLKESLDRSNFVEINTENQLGETERNALGINIKIPSHNYREVLCFARGRILKNDGGIFHLIKNRKLLDSVTFCLWLP